MSLTLLIWAAAGAAEAGCPKDTTQVGERREEVGDTIIVHPLCRRVPSCGDLPSTPEAIAREYAGLRRELQGNVNDAARNLDVLDEWIALGTKARQDARKNALGSAATMAIGAALDKSKAVARNIELDERAAAGLGRDWGYDVTRLGQMSDSAKAHVLRKVNEARTAQQAVTALQSGVETIDTSHDVGKFAIEPDWTAFGQAVVSALKLTESLLYANPGTSLLITDFENTENAVYGWWAVLAMHGKLKAFIGLEDKVLADSIRETNRYVLLGNAMAAIKRGEAYCAPSSAVS